MEANGTTLAVCFDIDGTLITSGGASAVAWGRAFGEIHGIAADVGEFAEAGMTDPEIGRRAFVGVIGHDPSPRELARLMARRLFHLPQAVSESEGYRVLHGVEQLLSRLCKDGFLLGLTAGNVQASAHMRLDRGNLNRWFSFGGYGSDSPDRAALTRCAIARAGVVLGQEVSPAEVLVVGDTPRDVEAGHAAGAPVVGVESGRFTTTELRDAGADYVVSSLGDEFPV